VIAVRVADPDLAARMVAALLVAGGAIPVPTDTAERNDFLSLAHDLGDGLAALPAPHRDLDRQIDGSGG
jgi:hypothetical protein